MTQSPSVLIVEDAGALRLLYKGWLELAGCQVDIAGTGSDALAKLSTSVFDVALLDIQLPDISGLENSRPCRTRRDSNNRRGIDG